jgi:hypothetical protein
MNNIKNVGTVVSKTYSRAQLRRLERLWRQTRKIGPADSVPETACGLSDDKLPRGAKTVGFMELAMALAADERGYALLTGVEDAAAGLDLFRLSDHYGSGNDGGSAFSFCVNGTTYTAFEDPEDGYRSAMGLMVARKGNWCSTRFEPCALIPRFVSRGYQVNVGEVVSQHEPRDQAAPNADTLELMLPGGAEVALAVGTDCSDDFYPSFVATHNPEVLTRAHALGIALAYELERDGELGNPSLERKKPRPRL